MAALLTKNNAYSTVATWAIGVGTGTFTVASSEGARFPTIAGGDWFYVTLQDASNNIEIVKITARATDTLTIGERAVEGTTARTWVATDVVELRLTAATAVATDTTQTLTNKTLTAPVLSGTVTGTYTLGGTPSLAVTGITGAGTGVLTALAVNIGSAGAFVPFDGDAGTPSAIVLTNASGTVTNLSLVTPVLGTPQSGDLSTCTADGTNAVGFRHIPQNSQSAAYELVLGDAGKHVYHPSADTTARIWTIPANASVAFPIGTAVTFINDDSAGVITIAITTDTMRLAGTGTTGSRTLAANGVATAVKMTATTWIISGTGLS